MKQITETDRDKSPLMKDLHELGLKHKVRMVVVAVSMDVKEEATQHAFVIDHKDSTTDSEAAYIFEWAGTFLIRTAGRIIQSLVQENKAEDEEE